jgi:glycine/D-amino acid oxidase-like deaminating enzyme
MVSQNQQGLLTIGDSHEYGNDFDPYVRSHVNQMILDYLSSIMHTEELKPVKMWTGVYAKLMNQDTEVFYNPEPGVYLVNGVGGAGMTMSFGLADEICNEI